VALALFVLCGLPAPLVLEPDAVSGINILAFEGSSLNCPTGALFQV